MLIKEDFDLTEYNSYKVKAKCSKAYFPENEQDLLLAFSEIGTAKKHIIGGGYNVILSKDYYDEVFIIFSNNFSKVLVDNNNFIVQSGATMLSLSELALDYGLSGLEIFYDIPGSLGGAIVMNAGSGQEEIKNLVSQVRYFDQNTYAFYVKDRVEIDFSYRDSFFQKNPQFIIVESTLVLTPGDKQLIKNKMESTKAIRHSKQPKEYPNAGSVFKRPEGMFVGPMIEELGLKGFKMGGAQVSEKHAGFIVNWSNATGSDILNLIEHIKYKVFETYKVKLEVEQRII